MPAILREIYGRHASAPELAIDGVGAVERCSQPLDGKGRCGQRRRGDGFHKLGTVAQPSSWRAIVVGNWLEPRVRRHKLQRSEWDADFGDIVVAYYQTPMVYEYPDGRVVNRDSVFKFTHTWRRTGKTWHIIGGMCGKLLPPTSP